MSEKRDLDRRLSDFYASEALHPAPDRVLQHALTTIETTRQRRELSLALGRVLHVNSYAKLAIAVVAVLAVGLVGITVLRPATGTSVGNPGGSAAPTPSSAPSVVASPSASLAPSAPPLSATYTSAVHDLSISYPSGWTVVPATEPESTADVDFLSPNADHLHDPTLNDHLFLALGSASRKGQTGEAWGAAVMQADDDCDVEPEQITIDGEPGLLCGRLALAWVGDRGYFIRLYTSADEPMTQVIFDQTFFEDVLTTVRLPPAT